MKQINKYIVLSFLVLFLTLPSVAMAKGEGNGTGEGNDKASDTGELYGDLYVIYRDINGEPIYDDCGCVQPIAKDGTILSIIVIDPETGEYECELSEDQVEEVIEVNFGRLSIARAPSVVLERSFDEAIKAMNSAVKIGLGPCGRFLLSFIATDEDGNIILDNDGNPLTYDKAIDSPLENLALYKKVMLDGHLEGNLGDYSTTIPGDPAADPVDRPTLNELEFDNKTGGKMKHLLSQEGDPLLQKDDLLRSASLLAAAADKTGHIIIDMVVYLNSILGLNKKVDNGIEYVDFSRTDYNRADTYAIEVPVLVEQGEDTGIWWETDLWLYGTGGPNPDVFRYDPAGYSPNTFNIAGFVQASDDALRVIEFIHTYQIPDLR